VAWLDLRAEIALELDAYGDAQIETYVERAFAESARRKRVRNASAQDRRQVDRLRRVHDRITPQPRPVVCECGERFATQGGLIGHVRFCKAAA
jgi:hypothetical protein